MSRLFILIVGLVALVVVVGVVVLGAFPPSPRTEQVQHVLPNDRFQPKQQ
ncbi:MAG: hypothetical protein JO157_12785 [Acetobacteraceae bacterium]|nr:hypothetical protein [Acetobacteraceae bacterium]